MNLLRLRYLAEYLVARVAVCVLQSLRIETCAGVARFLSWFCTDLIKVRGATIEENLRQAFPAWSAEERRQCTRRMWEHLFLFTAEVTQAPRKIRIDTAAQYIDFQNQDVFCRAMFADRGVLFVTAHFGLFEMLGYNAGLIGFRNHSVARMLDNPYLNAFVGRFREANGQYLIDKDGATDVMLNVIKAGGLVGILADQHAGRKGEWVNFFGRPAGTPKAIALLSLTYDVPIIVCTCRRTDRPMHVQQRAHAVFDPRTAPDEMKSVTAITQWFTTEFEKFIREEPHQYWWLHRRWKENNRRPRRERSAAMKEGASDAMMR